MRHVKSCAHKKVSTNNINYKSSYVSQSQTVVACALDPTDAISKLEVKEKVFNMMRGDQISFVAKKDLLIVHYGESYLKSQKRERKEYSCSSKIRELARLLIAYRTIVNDDSVSFKDLLHPEKFDNVVLATRNISGFDPIKKSFQSPSIAMHMGTSLKTVSDELIHLVLKGSKGFKCSSPDESRSWRQDIKNFKKLVESRWNTEISSVANKDLNEKRWQKPLLVPFINDVKIFREETLKFAKECEQLFLKGTDTDVTYKMLVQCTLALLILFNRRRIGDVQYLKVNDYNSETKTNFQDFESALSEPEKVLTRQYKRVVNGGKGSRAVVILVPQLLQHFISILLENRHKYIPVDNQYMFAIPHSKLKWAQGDVAIRHLTTKMKLQNAAAISSNKLRKHIATAMQVLTMSKNDCKQFSKFMGHTEKTHEEFYELPIDIYQTAKVVKVLLMMEKGVPSEYKGKSLSDIEIADNEYIEDNFNDPDQPLTPTSENATAVERVEDVNATAVERVEDVNAIVPEDDNRNVSALTKNNHTSLHKKNNLLNKRQGWRTEEIDLLKTHFRDFINKSTYPSGSQINDFIKATNSTRSVLVIRSKIQHILKQKN
ncbi:hypothetical protein PPYR_15247 [Photinus pyralis]|uniref:Uncharacterized protein n=1 Tax=Photinus pyralis TaxID=7054 RepID=A0A5N3ZZ90_PHOPY|nr:hypothetical protein PPYR_15247 [Photinus pyralis]